jgi:hypothetical protein
MISGKDGAACHIQQENAFGKDMLAIKGSLSADKKSPQLRALEKSLS